MRCWVRCEQPDQAVARLSRRYISQPRQKREDRVEQGRDEGEADGDEAEDVETGQEAGQADHRERQTDRLGEARRGRVLQLGRGSRAAGGSTVRKTQASGVCCTPRTAPSAKSAVWTASSAADDRAGREHEDGDQHDGRHRGGELRPARVDAPGGGGAGVSAGRRRWTW